MLKYVVALIAIVCFTSSAQAALLGLYDSSPPTVYEINPTQGAPTATVRGQLFGKPPVPPFQFRARPAGLTFLRGNAYASFVTGIGGARHVGVIDLTNNHFLPFTFGFERFSGLASNEAANLFYSVDRGDNFKLKTITTAGNISTIGSGTGVDAVALAFDDANGILYAIGSDADLYSIDVDTGVGTFIGSTASGASQDIGLAYDEEQELLFMVHTNSLIVVDTTTGLGIPGPPGNPGDGKLIGTITGPGIGSARPFEGLAWVNEDGCSALSCNFSSDVPAPSALGLLLFGLAGLLVRRVG